MEYVFHSHCSLYQKVILPIILQSNGVISQIIFNLIATVVVSNYGNCLLKNGACINRLEGITITVWLSVRSNLSLLQGHPIMASFSEGRYHFTKMSLSVVTRVEVWSSSTVLCKRGPLSSYEILYILDAVQNL